MTLICGLDLETTGLLDDDGTPGDQRIIEVCAKLYDLETTECRFSFTQRIDPQRAIAPKAQAIHHISGADLIGKPLWKAVAPKIIKILERPVAVVAHNGKGFDQPFLEGELRRIGLAPPALPWFDTMLDSRWATPEGIVPSLQKLCWTMGVTYDTSAAHAADYDVDVMMECFFKALKWGWFQLPEQHDEKIAA